MFHLFNVEFFLKRASAFIFNGLCISSYLVSVILTKELATFAFGLNNIYSFKDIHVDIIYNSQIGSKRKSKLKKLLPFIQLSYYFKTFAT